MTNRDRILSILAAGDMHTIDSLRAALAEQGVEIARTTVHYHLRPLIRDGLAKASSAGRDQPHEYRVGSGRVVDRFLGRAA